MAEADEPSDLECNICLALAQDPVITHCGHRYCWPCLYRWLKGHSKWHNCPVCRAEIDEDKFSLSPTDLRSKLVEAIQAELRPHAPVPPTEPEPSFDEDDHIEHAFDGLMELLRRNLARVQQDFNGLMELLRRQPLQPEPPSDIIPLTNEYDQIEQDFDALMESYRRYLVRAQQVFSRFMELLRRLTAAGSRLSRAM